MADQKPKQESELGNTDIDNEFFKQLPPGFRFKPHDEELISHYLDKKVHNKPLPIHNIIEVDLYKHNPQDLTDRYKSYGEDEWYFFTPRDRKYPKGERPKRNTIDGYWKATGADKKIRKDKKEIGCMKTLVYYKGKVGFGEKTDWIMREYRVEASKQEKGSKQLDDVVLCRLYKRGPTKSNKQKKVRNEVKENDQVMKADVDNKVPCNDMLVQPRRSFDDSCNVIMPPQYQNNFGFSSDYSSDSMYFAEPMAIDFFHHNHSDSMVLDDLSFPADADQISLLAPPLEIQNKD